MRIIVFLFFLLSINVNAELSLEKPISVNLSASEATEYESTIHKGNFSSNDFIDTLVFEGVLMNIKVKGDGENIYKFKVKKILNSSSDKKKSHIKFIEVVAPTNVVNGGVELKVGKFYRVGSPLLPDGRHAIWHGTIIELSGS